MAEIPFDIDTKIIDKLFVENLQKKQRLGDRGLLRVFLSSPIVIISGSMDFETFLEMSIVERVYFKQLLEIITQRQMKLLDTILSKYDYDICFWFGGSEQCTPPMMSPYTFDEFVVPYDKQIVSLLKGYDKIVGIHTHGKVKHALQGMIECGYDATDPVEPPPQGDVTLQEALDITKAKMTLMGNLQWSELERGNQNAIREKTMEILKHKNERIIMTASAGPMSFMEKNLIENYFLLAKTYKEYYNLFD
ncbi:MAG: uroporphyrinogen decarboxylase family protein [Eubacteriales bacterium]